MTQEDLERTMSDFNIKLGDLINVRELCESLGYPYYAALYVGIGEDVKPSSSMKDLDGYPLILRWFCNHRYEVIKVDKRKV